MIEFNKKKKDNLAAVDKILVDWSCGTLRPSHLSPYQWGGAMKKSIAKSPCGSWASTNHASRQSFPVPR